jgi:hypothetical protein
MAAQASTSAARMRVRDKERSAHRAVSSRPQHHHTIERIVAQGRLFRYG